MVNSQPPAQHSSFERGFMLSLIFIAILSLIWLFSPFLPALFFSMLIAVASFDQYEKFKTKFSEKKSAILMMLLVVLVIIIPLSYLLLVGGVEIAGLVQILQNDVDLTNIGQSFSAFIGKLPVSESIQDTVSSTIQNNINNLLISAKDFSVTVLNSIVSLSSNFLLFLIISTFSLYYFYIDGLSIVKKIKNLSPLENRLDTVLFEQFSHLSVTLVGSVLIVAALYGIIFSIGVAMTDLPILYFTVAMALASFIPVLGGMIIWLPLSIYLFATGETMDGFIIIFFGAFLCGMIIDNVFRPVIIQKLSTKTHQESALDHTLITVLSTLAGIIQFGILGLFLGPIIAAMAISIFDVYAIKYADSLDRS